MFIEEMDIIKDAIRMSRSIHNGGVQCFINNYGVFITNYVKFREYYSTHEYRDECNRFAIQLILDPKWSEIA